MFRRTLGSRYDPALDPASDPSFVIGIRTMRSAVRILAASLAVACPMITLAGCGSTPVSRGSAENRIDQANDTLKTMIAKDSSAGEALDEAHGYVVFSTVGSGAFIVGGEGGGGIVFEGGRPWGTASLAKGSIGLQIGGEAYSELVILITEEAFNRFTSGEFTFTADVTATAVKAGAAAAAPVVDGAKVLVMTKGGLMASAAVGGQNFSCTPFAE